jgi:hypothetical protein
MLKKFMAVCATACLLIGATCLTGGDPVIYVVVNSPIPDTTSDEQLGISGYIERTPQLQDAITVISVTGGAITAVDTATLHGLFTVTVPLSTNVDNHLSLTALDNTGASTTRAWERTVVHVDAPPLRQSSRR